MNLQTFKRLITGSALALLMALTVVALNASAHASVPNGPGWTCKNNAADNGCETPGLRCVNIQKLPSSCTWGVCPGCGQLSCHCP